MDNAFPDRLPLEDLFDGQRVDQRGRSAMLGFDCLFELVRTDFHTAVFSVAQFLYISGGHGTRAAISTSIIERQNLTMRMSMRRFTRLTNGFSKKVENMKAAVSLHFAHYNFVRQHKTLRMTPAMAAGVEKGMWSLGELVERTSR